MNNIYKSYSQLPNMIEVTNLIPFLLLGFMVGICGFFDAPYDRSHMVICDGEECLKANFDNCNPAYGNIIEDDFNIYFEIRGMKENGRCETYVRLDEINLEEVPENFRGIANLATGASMICEVENYEKEALLRGEFDKSMLSRCNGILANALETVIPQLE
jgi:hypothetical protein